jgi:predicted RecA/RadA family phage recombinase
MINCKQYDADLMEFAAPYDRLSGQGALIGAIFGVATKDILSGVRGNFKTRGVFTLAKNSAEAWTEGAKIYWDNTAKQCTTTATSNSLIGVAAAAAANPSSTGDVRLGIVA